MQTNSIRVVNATGQTVSRTSQKSANRMIRRGVARWRGNAIEMIESDGRVSFLGVIRREYTNGVGLATLEGLRHTPVVQPTRLLTGKRPSRPPVEDSVMIISVRALPADAVAAKYPTWKGERLT